ncbi:hypothetical protein JIN85_18580 [Luteolibacter pohnpeiensis]|uniref:Uncharacterized protein n=1 Tax=Luteolibacter pohnpeiensis TaxID=454153 RepID=A0A934SAJ8_9BACT|nr:hypothetical protein [Luteolibacter pohnpeiensis]MBK1884430.1 hypothetical protein [Luteolibacter pohnpeiensis]
MKLKSILLLCSGLFMGIIVTLLSLVFLSKINVNNDALGIKALLSKEELKGGENIETSFVVSRVCEISDHNGFSFEIDMNPTVSPDRSRVAWGNSKNSVNIFKSGEGSILPVSFLGDLIYINWVSNKKCKIVHTMGEDIVDVP